MNLLLVDRREIDASGHVAVTDARARHLIGILGVTPGQSVRIGIVDGPLGTARVVDVIEGAVRLACRFDLETPSRPSVDLLLALPRPKVMRRLWAQLAAVGVGRVLLTNAQRVERNYFDTHVLQPEVYTPLLEEGLRQARDTRLPLVSVHRRFRVLIEDQLSELTGDGCRVVADPSASARVRQVVLPASDGRVLLAIGPEGGWNQFELDLLAAHRFTAVGAGPRTLRADTACVALLALVHDALRP